MQRSATAAIAVCALGLAGCGGGGAGDGASSTPSIAKLTASASHLRIDSLVMTLRSTIAGGTGAGPTSVSGTVSLRLRPQLAGLIELTTDGQTTRERIVGNTIYVYLPPLAGRDPKRPWVAVDLRTASSASGIDVEALLAEARNADPTNTLRLLAAQHTFHETGTSTIDGQRVVGMAGSFTPATLTSPLLSPAVLAQLKQKLKQIGATRETVTSYLTYSGRPVRIVTTVETASKATITSTIDVKAINVPVAVSPPPAAQTTTLSPSRKLSA